MPRPLLAWGPAVIWMAVTFYISHQPAVVIPFGAPDYVAHFVSYGCLGALLVWALSGGDRTAIAFRLLLPAVVIASLYGASDEFHQSFVPGRFMSLSDWVADTLGATLGAALACALGGRRYT
jgi:VanZ family protein